MKEFNKEIKVNENEIIRYSINRGYVPISTVTVINLNDPCKVLRLSRWDDYGFNSYQSVSFKESIKMKKQLYTFDKDNPLYIPLIHLLKGEKELIIDDDDTYELNEKYMRIYHDGENINIEFINNLEEDTSFERFRVFIKNVAPDCRSKIDSYENDTKERLYFFFKEIDELFREEYHQNTIEEYLVKTNDYSLEESKKYTKKDLRFVRRYNDINH